MNFSEQPPSQKWAPLTYRGKLIAEVWFKPEGQPFVMTFRIPQESFHIPDMDQLLTIDNLLKPLAITVEDVESWCQGNVFPMSSDGCNSDLCQPLSLLKQDASPLYISVKMKPPSQTNVPCEKSEEVIPAAKWQNLETRWNTILGSEAAIESLRQRLETLRMEIETSLNKSLTTNEKVHALNADVAQWNKAKSRLRYVLPRLKEFIHRSTWAMGTPERKRLEEIFKNNIRPRIVFPQLDEVQVEFENMLKDRQILSAQGVTVYQEGQNSFADVQGALRTLQSNAAANAQKKRVATRAKGKSF